MTPFPEFEKNFKEYIYSLNEEDDELIKSAHKDFIEFLDRSEKEAVEELRSFGLDLPDNVIREIRSYSIENENDYKDIISNGVNIFFDEAFKNYTLNKNMMCLKSNLIGRACQMIHNEDMLGVIRNIDEEHSRYLFVDFGDKAEVKIDIDELIISGQKR